MKSTSVEKKKLLLVTTTPTNPAKGSFIRVLSIIEHLSTNFEIDLVAYNSSINKDVELHQNLLARFDKLGVKLHLTPSFFAPKLGVGKIGIGRLLLDFFVVIIICKLLLGKRYDVLHAEDFEAAAFVSVLSVMRPTASRIYDMHNRVTDNLEISGKPKWFVNFAQKIENFVVSRYNQLIVNWKIYREYAKSMRKDFFLYYDKSELVVDDSFETINEKYLAYSGNFAPYQGVGEFLSVYAKSGANFKVALVGEPTSEIKDLISSLGLNEKVILYGRLPIEQSNAVLKNSYMCLIPRVSGIQPGLKMIHHIMLGKVTLATNISANTECLRDGYNSLLYATDEELLVLLKHIDLDKADIKSLESGVIKSQAEFKDMWSVEYFINNYYATKNA